MGSKSKSRKQMFVETRTPPSEKPCGSRPRLSNTLLCDGQKGQIRGHENNGGQKGARANGDGARGPLGRVRKPSSIYGELAMLSTGRKRAGHSENGLVLVQRPQNCLMGAVFFSVFCCAFHVCCAQHPNPEPLTQTPLNLMIQPALLQIHIESTVIINVNKVSQALHNSFPASFTEFCCNALHYHMGFEIIGPTGTVACLRHQQPVGRSPIFSPQNAHHQLLCFLPAETHQTYSSRGKLLQFGHRALLLVQ